MELLSLENPILKSPQHSNCCCKIIISLKDHSKKLDVFKTRYQNAGFSLDDLFYLEGFDAKRMQTKPLMTLRQLDDLETGQDRYDHRFFNRPGGFGCYLSHAQAWKWCVEVNKPICIFEDDAAFPLKEKTRHLFESIIQKNQSSSPSQVILMGYNEIPIYRRGTSSKKNTTPKLVDVKDIFHGLQGYYITPKAASFLLEKAFPIEMQVDSFMGMVAKHFPDNISIKALSFPIVTQFNITGTSVQTKCTVCNGKINDSRFKISSKREKKEFCEKTGICAKPKSAAGSLLALATLASFLLLKK